MRDLEDKTFLLLAFLLILWPFSGAIIWGTVFAIVFAPLYRSLSAGIPRVVLVLLGDAGPGYRGAGQGRESSAL